VLSKPAGVRIIIGYKLAKAILQLVAALILFYGATHGLAAALAEFAEKLREHAVHAWSNVVAAALLRFTNGRHTIWLAAYALLGDALLSALEAWAAPLRDPRPGPAHPGRARDPVPDQPGDRRLPAPPRRARAPAGRRPARRRRLI
jgi:Predicted membrane protein (DUF2127)